MNEIIYNGELREINLKLYFLNIFKNRLLRLSYIIDNGFDKNYIDFSTHHSLCLSLTNFIEQVNELIEIVENEVYIDEKEKENN